ncbi:MAG: alkaline phosphatase PafA [Ferruginibacter sp.]
MTRYLLTLAVCFLFKPGFTQITPIADNSTLQNIKRPKLVVGIVVDQMRWDYLYRFYDRYKEDGGFKRLLKQGFNCSNTLIPYAPTITACGHSSIYTGSVPAINGITGNDWFDYDKNDFVYCTQDDSVQTIGSSTDEGRMSPKNLLTTTFGDELKLATNFNSKVIGIALKDRSAILPAGHNADAAYWYDSKTGDWITSSYYRNNLPQWLKTFNRKRLTDQYYAKEWNTLYPLNTYAQSAFDTRGFPRRISQHIGKNNGIIVATPYGNNFSFEMAKAVINGEQLGIDSITDLLTLSLSSPDYIGHAYGPNSVEVEDCFLRLDIELGEFLKFLDKKIGKENYLVFLTADHGAANEPAFLKDYKIPAGNFDNKKITEALSKQLSAAFSQSDLLIGILNYQVYLDRGLMESKKIDKTSVYKTVIDFLLKENTVEQAFALDNIKETTLNTRLKTAIVNGYYPKRSGDIQIILQPQVIDDFLTGGTTHGVWNPYDAHIPLLWYGWGIKPGKTYRETYITDIAATVAAFLNIQMPNGCVGQVIAEIVK